jgi:argininosuccinate synthase
VLEDPDVEVPDIVTKRADRRTITPEEAPDKAEVVSLSFERGDLVAVNGKAMRAHELLAELNRLGAKHGVGGLDLVENRYVGMKSRGYYETPGGTILWHGHRAIESITLDRGAMHLKDELMPKYASLIYNGFWWTPERLMLQAAIDASQGSVTGDVKLKLYKGGVRTVGRSSPYSLYSKKLVGFDEAGGYNQADAEGFIKLNALRLRILAERDKRRRKNE